MRHEGLDILVVRRGGFRDSCFNIFPNSPFLHLSHSRNLRGFFTNGLGKEGKGAWLEERAREREREKRERGDVRSE